MKPLRPLLAALALAALAACEEAPTRKPHAVQQVTLEPHREAADVVIMVRDGVRVTLPAPPPGLAWEIASNNNKVLAQSGPLAAGKDGTLSVTFTSLRQGKSVLRFVLVPPGSREAQPEAVCRVTIRIEDDE